MAPEGLREALDALCRRYRSAGALAADPIRIPQGFPDPADREAAAWLAAHLAYGRVGPMLRAIAGALAPLGPRPAAWLRARKPEAIRSELEAALGGWTWRFHVGADIAHWMAAWVRLDQEGGLEEALLPSGALNADAALSTLVQRLRRDLPMSRGLRFNLPDPAEGSACKRWRMFLRWMVRSDWPDLGLWKRYPRAALVVPLDTHVARVSRQLGLSRRSAADGRMAAEVTAALRALDPEDPLRFDFALSHLGILGDCPGRKALPACASCPLHPFCGER